MNETEAVLYVVMSRGPGAMEKVRPILEEAKSIINIMGEKLAREVLLHALQERQGETPTQDERDAMRLCEAVFALANAEAA